MFPDKENRPMERIKNRLSLGTMFILILLFAGANPPTHAGAGRSAWKHGQGAGSYRITEIPPVLGKANSWVWIPVVNNGGVVAAYANDIANPNAFAGDVSYLRRNGGMELLPSLPGATDTLATSLNDRDHAAGYSGADGMFVHAVAWVDGKVHDLGTLPGDLYSIAWSLNNRGQIVGNSYVEPDPVNFS